MPFEIIRNDITKMHVDAIVNAANASLLGGGGVDGAIHKAAGPGLLMECMKLGGCKVGQAKLTKAYKLPARFVIHTVGPKWKGGEKGEQSLLESCYRESLRLAAEHNCESIAFPLISSGIYGYPKDQALKVAVDVITEFLLDHDMQVYVVVFDKSSFLLSEKLFRSVASYIDENYVQAHDTPRERLKEDRRSIVYSGRAEESAPLMEELLPCAPMAASKAMSLEDMLQQEDAGFTETLLKQIDKTGKKDSEIYKRANLSKQHFSKIRNNPNYKPTKPTAIALALALELSLEDTKDLIGRAGYALSNSSKFDLIVRYFIENRNYNVTEINIALYEFDQPLLGA